MWEDNMLDDHTDVGVRQARASLFRDVREDDMWRHNENVIGPIAENEDKIIIILGNNEQPFQQDQIY